MDDGRWAMMMNACACIAVKVTITLADSAGGAVCAFCFGVFCVFGLGKTHSVLIHQSVRPLLFPVPYPYLSLPFPGHLGRSVVPRQRASHFGRPGGRSEGDHGRAFEQYDRH